MSNDVMVIGFEIDALLNLWKWCKILLISRLHRGSVISVCLVDAPYHKETNAFWVMDNYLVWALGDDGNWNLIVKILLLWKVISFRTVMYIAWMEMEKHPSPMLSGTPRWTLIDRLNQYGQGLEALRYLWRI